MMKHRFTILLMLMTIQSYSYQATVGDVTWYYFPKSNGCDISPSGNDPGAIRPLTWAGDLVVPSVIAGYRVISVSYGAFKNCKNLTSITFPEGCAINAYSSTFSGCTALKKIYVPEGFDTTNLKQYTPSGCTIVHYPISLSISSPHGILTLSDNIPTNRPFDVVSVDITQMEVADKSRYICTGWKGSGSVPSSGSSTNCTFVIKEPSTLTWNWKTQSLVSVSISGGQSNFTNQWIDNGQTVAVSITPDYSDFSLTLSGDTEGVTTSGSTVSIPVNGPRDLYVIVEATNPVTEIVNGLPWSYVVSQTKGIAVVYGGDDCSAIPNSTPGTILVPSTLGNYPVDEIGPGAFLNCNQLTRILFPGDAPNTVADDAFDGVDGNCTIHVRADADGWGDTFPGTLHGLTIMNDLCRLTTGVVGGGAVAGGGDFVSGDDAELIAYATDGFVFAYWTGDIASVSSNLTVTVVYDTTATAVFVPLAAADNLVQQRAEQNGYYTRDQIHELAIGNLMFDVDAGKARIGVKLMESSDLTNPDGWTPVKLSASDLDIGDDGSIGMSVNAEDGVRFFRLEAP